MTAGLLLAGLLAAGPAADPVAEVLALVPPDPAILLVVRDARGHLERAAASPLAEKARAAAGADWLAGPDLAGVRLADAFLTGSLGVTPRQLLDDVAGDAVAFAYTPPDGGGAGEVGVAYARPRNPDTLRAVLGKLTAFQTATGEVTKVESRPHAGGTYTARTKPGGGADYHAFRGGVFAFSGTESAVQDFLARTPSDAQADRLRGLGADAALAACVFRARAFDAELAAKAKAAKDAGEAAFLAQFQKVWAATDAVAVTAKVDAGVDLAVTAAYRPAALPPEVRALAELTPAGRFPATTADTLVAVGGRVDGPALLAAVGSFLPPAGRGDLNRWLADTVGPAVGRGNLDRVVAGFGPDVTAVVDAPKSGWAPAWTLAAGLDAPAQAPAAAGLAALSQFARFEYNRTHPDQLDLTVTRPADGADVIEATGPGLPAAVTPAAAVRAGHLVVASDRGRVTGFTSATPPPAVAPVARVHVPALRAYLRRHRGPLAAWLADRDKKPPEDVAGELAGLVDALDWLDTMELRHAAADGRVTLTLRVGFAASPKP